MKQIALVTGSSRGIGAACAKILAKAGYTVCVNYLQNETAANMVVQDIIACGGSAFAVKADVSQESDLLALFQQIDQQGTLSVLVNNAGLNGGISEVSNLKLQTLHHVFATNVYGTFIASREAMQRMKLHRRGTIINITSEAAKFGGTHLAHYAASKAAINTFTIAFAREAAPFGIRVNAVSPGVIATDIHQHSPAERIETLLKSLPMGRMGEAQEVAALVQWLVSEEASYISGAIIPVTGSR